MDSIPSAAYTLIALFAIGVPFLAIFTLVRVSALQKTLDQIPRMIARIYALEQRVAELQRRFATPPPGAETAPTPALVRDVARQQEQPVNTGPTSASASTTLPPAASAPQPQPRPPVFLPQSPHPVSAAPDMESIIAGRWLNLLGIFALVLAVAFFLKYAFDNNWVGPSTRIAIGLVAGFVMFPLSDWLLHRGYKYFAESLAGLGVAILYLTIWTGWHYYSLFSQGAAFGFMVLITAATAIVALVRDSQRIALLALLGGLLTPILTSTGENKEFALFLYLTVLALGVVVLSALRARGAHNEDDTSREWRALLPVMFGGTFTYFWGWYGDFYSASALVETIIFATVFFALFAALPMGKRLSSGVPDIVLLLLNAFQYLLVLELLLWPDHRIGLAFALCSLAAIHCVAALFVSAGHSTSAIPRVLYGGLAIIFVTAAVPVIFKGEWITIALAVEAGALTWGGLRARFAPLRIASLLIFPAVLIRLLAVDIDARDTLFFNARFLTFAACAVAMFAAFLLARGFERELGSVEGAFYYALSVCANVTLLAALSMEVWQSFGRINSPGFDQSLAQELALTTLWIVYAAALIGIGIARKSPAVRWQALGLLGLAIGKAFLFDLSFLTRFYRIISFLVLGLALVLISFFYQRRATFIDEK